MTVPSTTSRVTYAGDGSSVSFAISFYFLANADIVVLLVDADGNSTTQILNTHYTLTGAGVEAGGTLTMLTAPPSGYSLIIYRDPALTQLTDYAPNDPFPAETHERALDRLTMIAQRLKELVTRSIRIPDSDISGVSTAIPSPVPGRALKWSNDGLSLTNSSNDPDAVVATASGYADAAAASAVDSEGFADDASGFADAAAQSVIDAAAIYDAFDDRYLGSKSADPTVDNDGNALLTGALYWNTSSLVLKIYNGTSWQVTAAAAPASFTHNGFSGNGSTTAFTLSNAPASLASVFVFISGVAQRPTTDYTITGTTLTFTSAPPSGTNNISAFVASTVAAGTPDDGSVSTSKIQDGAITLAKLAAAIGTVASQAEMEAGTESALRLVSPLRVKQAIAANATQKTPNYGTGVGCAYNATIQAPADGVVIVAAYGSFRNGFAVYAGNTNATPNLLATVGDDLNNNTKGGSFSFPIKKDAFFKVAPWLTDGFETLTITFYANV